MMMEYLFDYDSLKVCTVLLFVYREVRMRNHQVMLYAYSDETLMCNCSFFFTKIMLLGNGSKVDRLQTYIQ